MILPAARIVSHGGTQGSGFVLHSGENGTFVLTNHHVIKDSIEQRDLWDPVEKSSKKLERLQPVSVEIFRYDERGRHMQTVSTSAEIVGYAQYGDKWDFEGDLALLKLKAPVEGVPASSLITEEDFAGEVRLLDEVVMVGCPEGSELPLPTTGHVASLTEERSGVGLLLSQVFGNPGSSGSAVYRYSPEREEYEVIAVHSMVDSRGSLTDVGRGSFLRLAVPAPKLHEFLEAHGFAELAAKPGGSGSEEEKEEDASEEAAEEPAGNESAADAGDKAAAEEEEDEAPAEDEEKPDEEEPAEPEGPAAAANTTAAAGDDAAGDGNATDGGGGGAAADGAADGAAGDEDGGGAAASGAA